MRQARRSGRAPSSTSSCATAQRKGVLPTAPAQDKGWLASLRIGMGQVRHLPTSAVHAGSSLRIKGLVQAWVGQNVTSVVCCCTNFSAMRHRMNKRLETLHQTHCAWCRVSCRLFIRCHMLEKLVQQKKTTEPPRPAPTQNQTAGT